MYEPKLDVNSALQGYIGADPVLSKAIEGYTQPVSKPEEDTNKKN